MAYACTFDIFRSFKADATNEGALMADVTWQQVAVVLLAIVGAVVAHKYVPSFAGDATIIACALVAWLTKSPLNHAEKAILEEEEEGEK